MSRLLRARPKLSFKKRSYPTRFKKFFDDLKTYPSTPLPHSLSIAFGHTDSVSSIAHKTLYKTCFKKFVDPIKIQL